MRHANQQHRLGAIRIKEYKYDACNRRRGNTAGFSQKKAREEKGQAERLHVRYRQKGGVDAEGQRGEYGHSGYIAHIGPSNCFPGHGYSKLFTTAILVVDDFPSASIWTI